MGSTFINVNDDDELYVWACALRIGPDQLIHLVAQNGPSVAHVREAIRRAEISRITEPKVGENL